MQRSKSPNSMKFKPPPKRKKVDPAPSFSSSHCVPGVPSSEIEGAGIRKTMSQVVETQSRDALLRIQQARNHAVAEAQQDGSTGNFRIFDSPFGNFLVPVIPTRAELGG